jgi:hypothetical protein
MPWGNPSRWTRLCVAAGAAALALATAPARADEIKLKDGTKISGTIVGFEENSFKVKTSYGFAEVQKDQVVSIEITQPAKKPEAKEKSAADSSAEKSAADLAAAKNDNSSESESAPHQPNAAAPSSKSAATPAKSPAPTNATASKSGANASTANAASSPSGAAPPKPAPAVANAGSTNAASAASKVPANASSTSSAPSNGFPAAAEIAQEPPKTAAPPEPMREEVTGNMYTNDTYGFHMYKPPDWQVIAGARAMLPGAITAMGTDDQRTYLLIGQSAAGKSLATDVEASEGRLRDIMENFRSLGETRLTVSGSPAIMHRFRGSVDSHDWSGVAVFVPHGTQLYTIFGMTLADNDLVQIQEAVIKRAIASLQFTRE